MIDFKYMTSGNEERIYNYLNNLCNNQECFCDKIYIRFLNAVAGVGEIDIYVDDIMVAACLKFGQITQYILSYPGDYKISIYENNKKDKPVFSTKVNYLRNTVYTAAVLSGGGLTNLCIIKEEKESSHPVNEAVISLINLTDKYNTYDLYNDNYTPIYRNAGYTKQVSNILMMSAIERFIIKDSNTNKYVTETPYIDLKKGMYYSIYIIQDGNSPRVFVISSGLNYLDIC